MKKSDKILEPQLIDEKDIVMKSPEKKECKTCKSKKLSKTHWIIMISSFYLLFASVYGTIKLINELINLF
jgi:hypothetical protein